MKVCKLQSLDMKGATTVLEEISTGRTNNFNLDEIEVTSVEKCRIRLSEPLLVQRYIPMLLYNSIKMLRVMKLQLWPRWWKEEHKNWITTTGESMFSTPSKKWNWTVVKIGSFVFCSTERAVIQAFHTLLFGNPLSSHGSSYWQWQLRYMLFCKVCQRWLSTITL